MIKGDRWIFVKGVIKDVNFGCVIGVVYGPHESSEKRRLWSELIEVRKRLMSLVF